MWNASCLFDNDEPKFREQTSLRKGKEGTKEGHAKGPSTITEMCVSSKTNSEINTAKCKALIRNEW